MIRILAWMMIGCAGGMMLAGVLTGRRIFAYKIRAGRLELRAMMLLEEAGQWPRPDGRRGRDPDALEAELLRLRTELESSEWRRAR